MTYDQTVTLTSLISAAQGTSFADESKIKIWYGLLNDLDFETAHLALKKLLRTKESDIKPAHIRKACYEIENIGSLTTDALTILNNAIRKFGYYRPIEAIEYIKQNDEITYEVVKAIGFRELCKGNPNFIRPEFENLYNQLSKTRLQDKLLSNPIKLAIADLRNKLISNNLTALTADCD